MQNQEVMGIKEVFSGDDRQQLFFDLQGGFSWSDASAVGNTKNVGVHRDGFFSEQGVENDICGFPAYTREFLQGKAVFWNHTAMLLEQLSGKVMDMPRLCIEEAQAANMAADAVFSQLPHASGVWSLCKQCGSTLVDYSIGTLRRKYYSDQKLEWSGVEEFRSGIWDGIPQGGKTSSYIFGIHILTQ